MAANATSWTKGRSGNPSGKPKLATSRRSLRAALSAPASPGSSETLMDRWAREMIASAVTLDDRLAVLRFLDGSQPTPNDFLIRFDDPPRILIPSRDERPGCAPDPDDDDDDAIEAARLLMEGDR